MQKTLKVEGMTCSCCAGKVEKSIHELDGVSTVKIDANHEEVQVDFNKHSVTLGQIKEKIEKEGYKVI